METFENQLEELKEKYWKTVTTKELLAAGFSRYKITQLVKTNVLTRDSRGQYYFTKNDVHARKAFNHFIQSILRYRNYERAYEDLRENIQFQETDQYDNHTILYVKMLEILLGSPSPSSLLEKLHYDESRDEWETSVCPYYLPFKKALEEENYKEALRIVRDHRKEELETMGEVMMRTRLWYQLMNEIYYVFSKTNPEMFDSPSPIQQSSFYMKCYYDLKEAIEQEQYDVALTVITRMKPIAIRENKRDLDRLEDVLSCYQTLCKEDIILEANVYQKRSRYSDTYYEVAMDEGDYLTAYESLPIYSRDDSHGKLRALIVQVLEKIYHMNQERVQKRKEKVKEFKKQEKTFQKQSLDEITQLVSYQFTQEELEEMILNRQYQELRQYLSLYFHTHSEKERVFVIVSKLLSCYQKLTSSVPYCEEKNTTYEYDRTNIFKYFYEALRNRDYRLACSLAEECEEIEERRSNRFHEFPSYRFLLEDIVIALDEYEYLQEEKKKAQAFEEQIRSYLFHQGDYQDEELEAFLCLLQEKAQDTTMKEEEHLMVNETIHLLEMMFQMLGATGEVFDYFKMEEYPEKTLEEQYHHAFQVGDLATAFQLLNSPTWMKETARNPYRRYYEVHKRLLWTFKRRFEKTNVEEELPILEKETPLLEDLQRIRSYVKNNDFVGAYRYYKDHAVSVSPELTVYMETILSFLKEQEWKKSISVYHQFLQNKRAGFYEDAKKSLQEYEELIQGKSYARNLDYQYERLAVDQQQIKRPHFAEEERLFDLAYHQYLEGNFQDCYQLTTTYIDTVSGESKGYLLRARCLEKLKRYEEAKKDYETSLQYIHNPSAYTHLGKLAYREQNYQQAKEYFESYEERSPRQNVSNLNLLRDTYLQLGDLPKVKQYTRIITEVTERQKEE